MSILTSQVHMDQALKLLCDVIEIKTVNPNGGEKTLANFIASYLENTGSTVQISEFAEGRANVFIKLKGQDKGNALMLNGHLDTVPFGSLKGWETPPDRATIKNGIVYGRGASDMKSGLCAALYAFKQLALEGFKPKNDIIFLGTGDEESYGLGAKAALKSGVLKDVGKIIIGEPTDNEISIASKGTLWVEFTITGRTSHGAYPGEGINASEIAYELFDDIKKLNNESSHKYLSKPTCTLTKIQGGVKSNMVPDLCTITLDIRTVSNIEHNKFSKYFDKLIDFYQKLYPGLNVTYKIINNRMPVEIDSLHPLVLKLSECIKNVTGSKPNLTSTGFFSDASIFLTEYNIPTVLFGPGKSSEAHKPNEKLCLDKYFEATECYYNLLRSC